MSYARFGDDSDVYVYRHVGGGLVCCGCMLQPPLAGIRPDFTTMLRSVLKGHLDAHTNEGHRVPVYTITRLEQELRDHGDRVA